MDMNPDNPEQPYEWRGPHDVDRDVMALLTCALEGDTDSAADVLDSLTYGQALCLAWATARWFAGELRRHLDDPLNAVRIAALDIARKDDEP
jgi:hypothetical protein